MMTRSTLLRGTALAAAVALGSGFAAQAQPQSASQPRAAAGGGVQPTAPSATVATAPLEAGSQAGFGNLRGRDGARQGPVRIAYVPIAPEFQYYVTMQRGVEAAAAEAGAEVITAGPPGSGDNQVHVRILEEIVARSDVHALIVAVRDANLAAPVLRRAADAGIVVVVTNSDLRSFPTPVHAVVGYSQRGANRLMGEHAGRLLAGRSAAQRQVAIVGGAPGYHTTEAEAGFREGLAATAPDARVVASRPGGWSVDGGRAAAEAILAEHSGVSLIWAANDNMIMGARTAVEAAGRNGVILLGRDGDPRTLRMIAEGNIAATTDTDPAAMGAASVRAIVDALAGRFAGGFVQTSTTVVTRDNARGQ